MEIKINENHHQDVEIFNQLKTESQDVLNDIQNIISEVAGTSHQKSFETLKDQFNSIMQTWTSLESSLNNQIYYYQNLAEKSSNKNKSCRSSSEKKFFDKKIRSLEVHNKNFRIKEKRLGKSLTRFRHLWDDSIKQMKTKISTQKIIKKNIRKSINKINDELTQEFQEILKIPFLESQKEFIFNRLPKNSISNKSNRFELRKANVAFHQESENEEDDSIEFEKCMKEIELRQPQVENPQNISIDKSFGGWKSEYESEGESVTPINPDEIKAAINILKKANLLNPQNGNILGKLTDVLKDSNYSENFELILQLANLQNNQKKTDFSCDIPSCTQKNLLPEDLACTTPKGVFIFPEELDPNKTMLSSKNPITVRLEENFDMNLDVLENPAEYLKDVQLEDLLNIPYFMKDIKFENTELIHEKPIEINNGSRGSNIVPQEILQGFENLSPSEVKASPARKQIHGTSEYQSTGVSSHSGLRSRITLKTAGSENSQKIFTPGSKSIEESFKYL
jgi:hypothetical protein